MANTGKKNYTGVPFGSNLYMVNPRYHNNFSTITYNGSTYPIKNILNLDKGNNAIEVEYDFNGNPMKEWITPSEDFWATNIPTDNQTSIQQTGYNGLDTLDKRAQMMATRGIGTGTFTGGELQPMTNYRSSIWDYKAPSIKGPAEDIDKVMLGTLGLGIAPVAIPEVATALSTMSVPFEQTIANTLANPYVQAGLTSAFAAGAAQEMPHTLQNTSAAREEFMQYPSWYTGLNYAGELGKLGLDVSMFASPTKALVQGGKQAYNFLKPSIDNASLYLQDKFPAVFDPYTSWDATMGYWGDNLASRTLGTVGRKFGWSPTSQIPEFHRRLSLKSGNAFKVTEDGKIILSSDRARDGHSGIVNMATSEPARSHNHHKFLSGYDDFIINPKALEGQNFLSIQPSDTFFRTGEFSVKPEYLTFVSGNPELLDRAQQLGMKTLSSPTLRKLVAEGSSLPNADGPINIRMLKAYDNAPLVGEEIQRLASMRGAPTMRDYAAFEESAGLNSGVVPNTQENYSTATDIFGRVGRIRMKAPVFNNVIYDPASSIESLYRKAIVTGEQEAWNNYWNALRRMPSAKSQLEGKGLYDTSISLPEHTLGESKIEQLSRNLNESVENTDLNVGEPTGGVVRTKLGDVEIDSPTLDWPTSLAKGEVVTDAPDALASFEPDSPISISSQLIKDAYRRYNPTWGFDNNKYYDINMPLNLNDGVYKGTNIDFPKIEIPEIKIDWRDLVTPEGEKMIDDAHTFLESLSEPLDFTTANKTPAGKTVAAMRKADKDIEEMNTYHSANVEEYNRATGSNVVSKPFRTNRTGRHIKILPKSEFEKEVGGRKTNSPTDDVRNIGGLYSKRDDTTYLRDKTRTSTAYHEFLHSNDYGETNPEVTEWRIGQLVDPEKIANLSEREKRYFLSNAEFPVHLRQFGESLGIKVGQPYPGDFAFNLLMFNQNGKGIGGATAYAKGIDITSSTEDKQLLWRALNGTLFGTTTAAVLGTAYGLSNNDSNVQALGGPLVRMANMFDGYNTSTNQMFNYYAPNGRYIFNPSTGGIMDTEQSSYTHIVPQSSEYITPEIIATPNGNKVLTDDRGDFAFSKDAYDDVQYNHNRLLNPYAEYLVTQGVAPKDSEVEYLMANYRADNAADKANLSPLFADIMTGGYASSAERGINKLRNGNIDGIVDVGYPLLFGNNFTNTLFQGLYGGVHLIDQDGIPKTYGIAAGTRNDGVTGNRYVDTALSASGDIFNTLLAAYGLRGMWPTMSTGYLNAPYMKNPTSNLAAPYAIETAKQKMSQFVGSKEYEERMKQAGLEKYWNYMKKLVNERMENMPVNIKYGEDFPAMGSANAVPFSNNYGVSISNDLDFFDFINTLNHEIAHFSSKTASPNQFFNFLMDVATKHRDGNVLSKLMQYNNSLISPPSFWKYLQETRPDLKWWNPKNFGNIWDNYQSYRYYTNPQEVRSRAYEGLQQALALGQDVDSYVDQLSSLEPWSQPYWYSDLSKYFSVDDIKNYMKKFLSIGAPVGGALGAYETVQPSTGSTSYAQGGPLVQMASMYGDGGDTSELDWSPESWFSLRTPKPDGTLYNSDEAVRLKSHVPEFLNIEKNAKANGTWLKMPDGSTWQGDPRSWVMMQSKAFKQNYDSQPWYTGQAEWPTEFDYPKDGKGKIVTNKMTRAPYYDGQMWFSNNKSYGDAFAYYYGSDGDSYRKNRENEKNIWGHNFLAAIPKRELSKYRSLAAPIGKTSDDWRSMPYSFHDGRIYRLPNNKISTKNGVNSRADKKTVLTDDVVNWSKELGDNGIFLHKVNDGQGIRFSSPEIMRKYNLGQPVKAKDFGITRPIIEEFISQPGFTKKVKFIEGNTGDFDITNPYKYAYEDEYRKPSNYAANGGPLVQLANKYELGGPEKKETPLEYTHRRFPITQSFDLHPYLDPNFTPRDMDSRYGDIEYIQAQYDGLPYYNHYTKPDSLIGKSAIVYNDRLEDLTNESVALDALSHGLREQDPVWQKEYVPTLNDAFRNHFEHWKFDNQEDKDAYVDGFVRNMMADPSIKREMGYWDEELQEAAQNPAIHNALTEAYSYINPTQLPEIVVEGNQQSEGGSLNTHKKWEDLSMKERGEMIRVAIRNGITNLSDIKSKYNEFAEGGNLYAKGNPLKKATLSPNVQYAMRYFINKGLAPHQAAGLVGNLMRESSSNLDIDARNPNGGAFGIAQWLGARQKNLFARYGRTPSLQQQLDYVWHELNTTHKNGLRSLLASKDAAEAARNAFGWYEFSVGPEGAVADMNRHNQNGTWALNKGVQFASQLMGQPVPQIVNLSQQQQIPQVSVGYVQEQPQGAIIPPLTPFNQEAFYGQNNSGNNQVLIDTMNAIQDQFNAYQEEVRQRELAQQEAAEKQNRMQGLSTLFGMMSSMNGDEDGTSPYSFMSRMLTMVPSTT